MTELVGDSTRDGCWALVRLAVEGERIVHAQAEGLERPLEGLTLLESAAVGGDELAVDALANALGPAFRATHKAGRVAVAMSGGVDSAVALLRAGPEAIGVTLRLLLARGRARGTGHLPWVGAPARDARPPRAVQAGGRRAVRARLRSRPDTEPLHSLQ